MTILRDLMLVGTGGFVGAVLRYGASLAFAKEGFPLATLLVNVAGSFALGFMAVHLERGALGESHRHLLGIGLLGAFTTFSTFSVETVTLLESGAIARAAMSVALNVTLAIAAAAAGVWAARLA